MAYNLFIKNPLQEDFLCAIVLCREILAISMRKSSARHRLINRTSEVFADLPDSMDSDPVNAGPDVSVVVASQLGKATPCRDQKGLSSVLFSGKKGKKKHDSDDQSSVSQNSPSSAISTAVSEAFEFVFVTVQFLSVKIYRLLPVSRTLR